MVDRQPVQQHVGIDVVIAIAGRNVRIRSISEQAGERRFLAIEIGDVGDVAPLLQQIGAAGDVADPGPGLLGPGVQPVERLAED